MHLGYPFGRSWGPACKTEGPLSTRLRHARESRLQNRTVGKRPIPDIGSKGRIDSMGTKRGGMTFREAMAQNDADPAYRAMRRARDSELAKVAEQRRQEQQRLLNDLSDAGVSVAWVGKLCSISAQ